jgi:membrane protein involved in colicin uptake
MIAMVQSSESLAKERHEATLRKQRQLEEAEKEHERLVAQEEAEEAAEAKRKQEEEEKAALEAARNSP